MTAHHVVAGCRSVTVLAQGKWIPVTSQITWHDGNQSPDVTTLKLAKRLETAHVFSFRASQVPIHGYIAALGYPLAEGASMTNGRVIARTHQHLFLRILAAQGYSGGPIVDPNGQVVGLVNFAYMSPGALTGAGTGDNTFAYDFSSRWGGWRSALCHTYRFGEIQNCG
jgi:S1-C subfamily serine protease